MSKDTNKITERVQILIDKRGWTRQEMAKRMGLSQSGLSNIMAGNRPWRMESIDKAAEVLNVDVLVLLGGEAPSKVSGRVCFELDALEMKQLLTACADELRTPENLSAWVVKSWLRSRRDS